MVKSEKPSMPGVWAFFFEQISQYYGMKYSPFANWKEIFIHFSVSTLWTCVMYGKIFWSFHIYILEKITFLSRSFNWLGWLEYETFHIWVKKRSTFLSWIFTIQIHYFLIGSIPGKWKEWMKYISTARHENSQKNLPCCYYHHSNQPFLYLEYPKSQKIIDEKISYAIVNLNEKTEK